MYLSRLRAKSDFIVKRYIELSKLGTETTGVNHKVIWFAFADNPDRRRDFLWAKDEEQDIFTTLSLRRPVVGNDFVLISCEPYGERFEPGLRLGFTMRFNPASYYSKSVNGSVERKRSDIFFAKARQQGLSLKDMTPAQRERFKDEAASEWIEAHAAASGFSLKEMSIVGEELTRIDRTSGQPATFTTVDVEGVLDIVDPVAFRRASLAGFGRAKAFGCGLLLAGEA